MKPTIRSRLPLLFCLGVSSVATANWLNAADPRGQGSAGATTAFMKSGKFEIPFNLDTTGARPSEVQLFVSQDSGATWQLFSRQPPTARNFTFDAAGEGTYWFATRTIVGNGSSQPSGPVQPQLCVTVDASNPNVEANVDADGNGQLILDYTIVDASPAEEGIRAEYQTDTSRTWIPVTVASQANQKNAATELKGRMVWVPEGTWRHVFVRMFVRDRAGNETVLMRQVERPRLAQNPIQLASNQQGGGQTRLAQQRPLEYQPAVPFQETPLQSTPTAPPVPQQAMVPTYPANSSSSPANGYAAELSKQLPGFLNSRFHTVASELPAPQPSNTFPPAPAAAPATTAFPAPRENIAAPFPSFPMASELPGNGNVYSPGQLPPQTEPTAFPTNPSLPNLNGPVSSSPPSASNGMNPSLNEQFPANSLTSKTEAAAMDNVGPLPPSQAMRPIDAGSRIDTLGANASGTSRAEHSFRNLGANPVADVPELQTQLAPSGEKLTPSRSRQFSLDYEVESVGTRGVEDVELWGTRDYGKVWERWGSDPDKMTPFDIETTGEGIYGFRIVVVGGNGLASPRPQPGEPADVYILVDTNAPVIRLTSAQYGEGDYEGSLVIRYACSDANLANRPISLSFGESPQGPWTTIAAGLPNSGEYLWAADPQLPRQIFLRVEAIDEAGNIGTHTLDSPISVQGLAPKARIRGFTGMESGNSGRSAGVGADRR